jgi:hypothetical protein
MKTFNNSTDLLKNWDSGQGKTSELADLASLSNNQLTYDGYTVEVSTVWQEAALIMYMHKELKTKPVDKQRAMLDIFSQGRLSDNHKFDAGNKPAVAKPLPNHYLSSVDLRANYFELTEVNTVASVYQLLTEVNGSMTKDKLIALIESARELIISADQAETLAILQDKESALSEARTKLEAVGCSEVKFISETSLSAIVPYAIAAEVGKLGLAHLEEQDKLLGGQRLLATFELVHD